jgi:hypothetical protein
MVVKTELCTFSEWKIYPGKGVRYVAKDGRPFLYLSKRNRNFSIRYIINLFIVNSKHKDLDGLLLGEDYIRKLKYLILVKLKELKLLKFKELLKVSLLKPLRK